MKLKQDNWQPSPEELVDLQSISDHREEANLTQLYMLGRREWNERYGSYIADKQRWQTIAFGSMAVSLILAAGVVYMASQNKLVPYVVEVDKLGTASAVQKAVVASQPNQQVIKAHLARWVENTRSVYLDAAAQQAAIKETYASINQGGLAYASINDYFKLNNPFERAKDEAVNVQIASVLPISDKTWRVEWKEERRARDGRVIDVQDQQATISIAINPPSDEATILVNPLGIYVDSFSWSKRL